MPYSSILSPETLVFPCFLRFPQFVPSVINYRTELELTLHFDKHISSRRCRSEISVHHSRHRKALQAYYTLPLRKYPWSPCCSHDRPGNGGLFFWKDKDARQKSFLLSVSKKDKEDMNYQIRSKADFSLSYPDLLSQYQLLNLRQNSPEWVKINQKDFGH